MKIGELIFLLVLIAVFSSFFAIAFSKYQHLLKHGITLGIQYTTSQLIFGMLLTAGVVVILIGFLVMQLL